MSYSSLNTARSAISAVLKLDNKPAGQHDLVVKFMKGIFNSRPSVPKHNFIWDTKIVLNYLASLSPIHSLSLKMLTLKTVTLLLLVSSQRIQTLHLTDLDNVKFNNDCVQIHVTKLLKQSRPSFHLAPIFLKKFVDNSELCIVTYLKEYIKKTSELRKSQTQLFISYHPPYKKVGKETLSRWVRIILAQAGIDISVFKTHSTRSASVSKAAKFAPISSILNLGGWSSDCTFAKHYNKPIVNDISHAMLRETLA